MANPNPENQFVKGSNRGGRRAGAGRKPGSVSVSKKQLFDKAVADAEHAFKSVVSLVDDMTVSADIRLRAAQTIMDRVWGKATERREDLSDVVVRVIYDEGIDDDGADNQNPSVSPQAEVCKAEPCKA